MKVLSVFIAIISIVTAFYFVANTKAELRDAKQEVASLTQSVRSAKATENELRYCNELVVDLYDDVSGYYELMVDSYNNNYWLGEYVEGYFGAEIDSHNQRLEFYNNRCAGEDTAQLR